MAERAERPGLTGYRIDNPHKEAEIRAVDTEMARLWLGIGIEKRLPLSRIADQFGCSEPWAAKRVKRALIHIVSEYIEKHQTE